MTTLPPAFNSTSQIISDSPDRMATRSVMIFLGSTSCDIGTELFESIRSWTSQDLKHIQFIFMDTNQEKVSDLPDDAKPDFIKLTGLPRLTNLPQKPYMMDVVHNVHDLTLSRNGAHGKLANSAVAARGQYSKIEQLIRRKIEWVNPRYLGKSTVRVHIVAFLGGGTIGALPVVLGALSAVKREIEGVQSFLHLLLPDKDLTEDPDRLFPWQLRNAYSTLGFLRQVSTDSQRVTVDGPKIVEIPPDAFELAFLYQSPAADLRVQKAYVGRNLKDTVADGWGAGKQWRERGDQAIQVGDPKPDSCFASIHSKEVTLLSTFFVQSAKEYLRRKWSTGLTPQNRATQSRPNAPKLPEDKKKDEWKTLRDREAGPPKDALGFLNPGLAIKTWEEIKSQLESAFLPLVSSVRDETSRSAMTLAGSSLVEPGRQDEANSDIGDTLTKVRTRMSSLTDRIRQGIAAKTRALIFYDLILSSEQSTCEAMLEKLPYRPESIKDPERPTLNLLRDNRDANEKYVKENFEPDVHKYLYKLMWNQIGVLIDSLEEELKRSIESWRELIQNLRERAAPGGALAAELGNPESWTFEGTDPTVENILQEASAQKLAASIVDQVYLEYEKAGELAERLVARSTRRVYGSTREDRLRAHETEQLIAEGIASEIQRQLSDEHTFLTLPHLEEGGLTLDWNDRVKSLCAGVTSLDEYIWMDGGMTGGSIESIECVGAEGARFKESIALSSLWDGGCICQESYPSERLRLKVQRTVVGAPLSNLVIFRDMLTACHHWFHSEERAGTTKDEKWKASVSRDLWGMYPERGSLKGFIELFGNDWKDFLKLRPVDVPRQLVSTGDEGLPQNAEDVEELINAVMVALAQ